MTTPAAASPSHVSRARALRGQGRLDEAVRALSETMDHPADIASVLAADRLLGDVLGGPEGTRWARRSIRLALAGSHTSGQLAAALRVALARLGIAADIHETAYRAYAQEIADPASALYAFAPDVCVVVADHRELRLPPSSSTPEEDLAREVARWRELLAVLAARSGASIVMTTFVAPPETALGHLGLSHPGGFRRQVARLNLALGDRLPQGVALVDAEAVALRAGAGAWFDTRYWYLSKHAVGLGAVPLLAAALADVTAASLGLSRKVVVVDLDNTLWGGVIGEDGLAGLVLGGGPAGEAFVDFQEYLRSLGQRGLVLAVCSKNNPNDARLPFERHPEMRLGLGDFVAFEASWEDKPAVLRRLAAALDVGLDALVFVDDNPVEREAVRRQLPEVGVVELPADATGYRAALASFPGLESVALTEEDARRTEHYRARARAREAAGSAASREDFLAGLGTHARIEPLGEVNLPRIVQLIGKTNQLNLTTRRHTAAEVTAFAEQPGAVVWGVRVRDRFDDHGLVAVVMAAPEGETLALDTFVMSCRVLGRDVERAVLGALVDTAARAGLARVLATYVPTGRNVPAADVLPAAGFTLVEPAPGDHIGTRHYEIATTAEVGSPFVSVTGPYDDARAAPAAQAPLTAEAALTARAD